jgi:hypothetical protein
MAMASNLSFKLSIKFDDRPLKTPHLRRLSLILKSEGSEEIVIRGFLLPQGNKQLFSPSTLVSGRQYDICQMSPALQEAILNSFSFEDLFPVNRVQTRTLLESLSTSEIRDFLK